MAVRFLLGTTFLVVFASLALAEQHPGAAIYRKLCAECHGKNGEGVDGKADDPLYGSRDLVSLTRRIERTMPEDDEGACVGNDAKAVAAYIYHAFYSVEARNRNQQPEIQLSRLTVPQFRRSVADLARRPGNDWLAGMPENRGLKARYWGTREYRPDPKKKLGGAMERIDPVVKFDFGTQSPDPKKLDPEAFSARWEGLILAEETGVYEFTLKTQNGALLWINRRDKEERLIDAYVSTGEDVREESAKVFLLGQRAYALRLDYFSYKEKTASIELLWKPPHGIRETVPNRVLAPGSNDEMLIVDTPFPADDRSVGYERGTSVSRSWMDAVTAGAMQAAERISARLDKLAKTKRDAPDRAQKVRKYCENFAEAALRRPLTDQQRRAYVGRWFEGAKNVEQAAKRSVMMALTSPQFLYPQLAEADSPDQWDVATRLALALWDSVPDRKLADAARKGRLKTWKQIEDQGWRMLYDPRARGKLREFFDRWLELERARDVSRDAKLFPEFGPEVMADLRTSLDLFIDQVFWSQKPDFRQLLLADYLYLNERLAPMYGVEHKKRGFAKLPVDSRQRSGIVTHPYLLATFAYHNDTSPIHRGVFLTRNIVGMSLKPPPEAVAFEDAKFDPSLTMREKVTELTRSKACMACHSTINPLGFSLENYDAIGRWRTRDARLNKPIDASGDFVTGSGETIQLKGARDLAQFAANHPEAHRAFIRQLFHHVVKQPAAAFRPDLMAILEREFHATGYNMQVLLVKIAAFAACHEIESAQPQ